MACLKAHNHNENETFGVQFEGETIIILLRLYHYQIEYLHSQNQRFDVIHGS